MIDEKKYDCSAVREVEPNENNVIVFSVQIESVVQRKKEKLQSRINLYSTFVPPILP